MQEEEKPKEEMKARNKQNLLSMHIFGHILCSMHMEFALEHNVTYQLMFYCIPVPSVFFRIFFSLSLRWTRLERSVLSHIEHISTRMIRVYSVYLYIEKMKVVLFRLVILAYFTW